MSDDDTQKLAVAVAAAVQSLNSGRGENSGVLKWVAGIIGALLVMAIGGSGAWLINTVNDMQQTLGRLDERTTAQIELQQTKDQDLSRRVGTLEAYHHLAVPSTP